MGVGYGIISKILKDGQAQYPWLNRGMIYHLFSTLDSLIKKIIIYMGIYPYGRQAVAFKSAFETKKEKPQLKWLDETFVSLLFKQEICRWGSPFPTVLFPPPISGLGGRPSVHQTL
jgi:hypothetical protein